jgi:hypothetical protein
MNSRRNRMLGALVAALMIVVGPAALAASVPATVGYQGRLYDQSGTPVSGTMSVTFSLYASATGGTAVWSETQSVSFANGYFAVQLGSVTGFGTTAFDGTVRYLGVKVGSDAEMTPRAAAYRTRSRRRPMRASAATQASRQQARPGPPAHSVR